MVSKEETRAIDDLIERLTAAHPDMEREKIASVVDRVHEGFSASKVRDFVPLFVERRVHVALGEHDAAGVARFDD